MVKRVSNSYSPYSNSVYCVGVDVKNYIGIGCSRDNTYIMWLGKRVRIRDIRGSINDFKRMWEGQWKGRQR